MLYKIHCLEVIRYLCFVCLLLGGLPHPFYENLPSDLSVGVHSALQHDTIMNSSDPDSVLVESEASKVAKSAARALKASRRHCLQMGAGRGHPTWTGQHGMAGAPVPPPPR